VSTVTIEEAQARLPGLIAELKPGEAVLITQDDRPVARLVAERKARKPRNPGSAVGQLTIVSEDDEHLKDFKEYMP
jgi:antitoxin (DNA-binding transcriptional repressor) of toxin-antitoxin stability system